MNCIYSSQEIGCGPGRWLPCSCHLSGEGPLAQYGDGDCFGGLSTRFFPSHKDEEVAHCHMSYRDGSYDPSLGPTIEIIAVKQYRRGGGLGISNTIPRISRKVWPKVGGWVGSGGGNQHPWEIAGVTVGLIQCVGTSNI